METYKQKVRTRANLLSLVALLTAVLYVVFLFIRGTHPDVAELPSFIKGFHIGAFIGLELLTVYGIAKHFQALKNDDSIKRMYISEHDERSGLIIQSASVLGMSIILIGLGLAAIIAGFFSSVVFSQYLACCCLSCWFFSDCGPTIRVNIETFGHVADRQLEYGFPFVLVSR